jgi:hypothetical protein
VCKISQLLTLALGGPFSAGIELRGKERRSRGIDYNAEVAFEKKPAPGFYDTGAETSMTKDMQQEFRPTTVEEMEGKRRKVRTRLCVCFHKPLHALWLCIAHVHQARVYCDYAWATCRTFGFVRARARAGACARAGAWRGRVVTLKSLMLCVVGLQDIEEALVKRDIKRQKLAEAKNVPGLVARVNEMNSTALRRRTKMMLPAPQVNQHLCLRSDRVQIVHYHAARSAVAAAVAAGSSRIGGGDCYR